MGEHSRRKHWHPGDSHPCYRDHNIAGQGPPPPAPGHAGIGTLGPTGFHIAPPDSKDVVLNFGAFKGYKLGQLLKMDRDTVKREVPRYFADGPAYLKWLASDKNNNEFIKKHAREVLGLNESKSTNDIADMLHGLGVTW